MFKFLKDKIKKSVLGISEKIEEEGEETVETIEKEPEKKGFFSKVKEKFSKDTEEGFEEEKVEPEVKVDKEKIKKAEKKVEEKIQKKEIPTLHELAERKQPKKKKEEPEEVTQEAVGTLPAEEILQEVEEEEKFEKEISEQGSESLSDKSDKIPKIEEPEKKGFLHKIKEKVVTTKIPEHKFDDIFWDLELALLENNVAVEVIEKIKRDLKNNIVDKPIKRGEVADIIEKSLKDSINGLFIENNIDLLKKVKEKKPYVICFIGINGSGKTTTIAKIANLLKNQGLSCVLAAADTFRAAAIDQLEEHANKLRIKLIKHDYGSDPAAVAFDAIKHAEAKDIDVVLIDTAGRMHSNTNLLDEMKKIIRVAVPDMKIFVGESITGNDCVDQAKKFDEAVGIDAIILSKADIDEKGGAAISVSYVTKRPIIYIGVGQGYNDIKEFQPELMLSNLGI